MNIIQPLKGCKLGHISMLVDLWAMVTSDSASSKEHPAPPCRTPGA